MISRNNDAGALVSFCVLPPHQNRRNAWVRGVLLGSTALVGLTLAHPAAAQVTVTPTGGGTIVSDTGTADNQTAGGGGVRIYNIDDGSAVTVSGVTINQTVTGPTANALSLEVPSGIGGLGATFNGVNTISTAVSGGAAVSISNTGNLGVGLTSSGSTFTGSYGFLISNPNGFGGFNSQGQSQNIVASGTAVTGISVAAQLNPEVYLGTSTISGFATGVNETTTDTRELYALVNSTGGSISASQVGIRIAPGPASTGIVQSQSAISAPIGIQVTGGGGATITTSGGGTINSTSSGTGTGIIASSSAGADPVSVTVGAAIGGTTAFATGVNVNRTGSSTGALSVTTTAAVTGTSAGIVLNRNATAVTTNTVNIGGDVTGGTGIDTFNAATTNITVQAGATVTGNSSSTSGLWGFGSAGIVTNSSASTVMNSGTIRSTGTSVGNVGLQNLSGAATTNTATGVISGRTGIYDNSSDVTTNAGTITGTGTAATEAAVRKYGGTLTNTGTITGAADGILNAANTLTVGNTAGTITGATNGIDMAGGFLRLTNTGTVQTTGGTAGAGLAGVYLNIASTASNQQITNSGTISGGSDATHGFGVDLNDGILTLTNQSGGNITGGTGGIRLASADAATINLNAGSTVTGQILSTNSGDRTISVGGTLTGNYVAGSGTGVNTFTLASTGSMAGATFGSGNDSFLYQGGTFSGTINGGGGTDSFTSALGVGNSASINISNITGFETQTHQSGTLTLTGSQNNSAVWTLAANATLNLAGSITNATGTGFAISASTPSTINVLSTGVLNDWVGIYFNGPNTNTVGNAGSITGNQAAIATSSGAINLTNSGSITSTASDGVALAYGPSTVLNTGTITGSGANNYGVSSYYGPTTITNNAGAINGVAGGVTNTSGTLTVINAATISGTGATSSGVNSGGTSLSVTNQSGGVIAGLTNGVNATAGSLTVTNAGTIGTGTVAGGVFTAGGTGNAINLVSATGNVVDNSGTISGAQRGISVNAGAAQVINRAGTIGGTEAITTVGTLTGVNAIGAAINASLYSAVAFGGNASGSFTNGGTLVGGNNAAYGYGFQSNTTSAVTFNNYGSSTASQGGVAAISSGALTINLFAGSTTGNIIGGSGNDVLALYNGVGTANAGTTYNTATNANGAGTTSDATHVLVQNAGTLAAASFGAIDLGGGTDTLMLRGTGDGTAANGTAGSFNIATSTGAEILTKADLGTWTLTGAAITPGITINAGTGGAPNSGGTLIFNGTTGLTGAINVNGGAIRANTAGAFGTGTIHAIDPTIQFAATGTYANPISLESTNPSTDPTVLQTFGTGVTATLSGAITQLGATAQPVVFSAIDTSGNPNTGTIVLTNNANSWMGATTINAGLTLQGASTTISGNAITNNGALIYNQTVDGTAAQNISGTGSLTKIGSAVLTLSGANTYSGATNVNAGTLTASGGGAIGDSSAVTVASGATFAAASNETVGSVAGAGTINVGANTVTAGGNNASTTFSGNIIDAAALAYIGSWRVDAGAAYGTNPPTYTGLQAAAFLFGGTAASYRVSTVSNQVGQINDSAWYAIYGVGFQLSGATYHVDNGAVGYSQSGDSSAYVHDFTDATKVNYAFGPGGTLGGGFTKTGTGTLTLSGTNTYTGLTSIIGGTLLVQGGAALADTNTVNVGAAGTFAVASSETIGSLTGSGTTTLSGSDLTLSAASGTYSGTISGSGSLNLAGGSETLAGALTNGGGDGGYGSTVVVSGTGAALSVASTGSITSGGYIGVRLTGAGATLANLGSITNTGTAGADQVGAGVAIYTVGGTNTVTNGSVSNSTATISGYNNAIDQRGSATTALTINNYGSLKSTVYSTIENSGSAGALTVNNLGTAALIYAPNGSNGINANAATGLTLNNQGLIVAGGNAVNSGGVVSITNSGLIGAGGFLSGVGLSTYASGGGAGIIANSGGTITNNLGGTISGSVGVSSNAALALTNNAGGFVVGASRGISGTTATIINSGTIGLGSISGGAFVRGSSSGNGVGAAISLTSGGSVTNNSGGAITGSSDNVFGNGSTQAGIYSASGLLTVDNSGAISGGVWGIAAGTGTVNITNRSGGTITGTTNNAVYAGTGANSIIVNNGSLIGGNAGVYADGTGLTITNTGLIRETGAPNPTYNTVFSAIYASAAGAQITNSSTIESTLAGGRGIYLAGGTGTITNQSGGTISGGSGGAAILLTGTGYTTNLNSGSTTTGNIDATGTTGTNSYVLAGTLNGGLTAGSGNDTVTLFTGSAVSGNINGGAGTDAFILNGTGAGTLNISTISNFESLTKNGSGTFTLTGTDATGLGWTINSGTLNASGGNALADGAQLTVNAPGTLGILANETIGSLAGAGNVALAGTLTTGGTNASSTFSGVASGTGGLIKTGTGTFTLSGANTFTGDVLISAGTLAYGADNVLADTVAVTVNSGATFNLNGYSDTIGTLNLYGTLANGGLLTAGTYNAYAGSTIGQAISSGTLNIYGNTSLTAATAASPINIYSGTLTTASAELLPDTGAVLIASGGQLTLGGAETIGSLADLSGAGGTVELAGNLLTVGGDNSSTGFSGVIQSNALGGSLTKNGTGTLTLSGTNTYDGLTTINGGMLTLSGGNAIADGSSVLVNGAGTLALLASERIGSLTGSGAVSLDVNTLYLGTNDLSSTFSGVISGSGGITQTGAGTLTLSGANSYTGTTYISGSNFVFGASDVLADTSTLFVTNGTVDLGANSDTIDHFAMFGGTLNGTGTLTSTGASGFQGYTLTNATINANLGTGSLGIATGNTNTILNGTAAVGIAEVETGTLTLGASDRIADSAAVYVDGGAVLDLGAFSDTVGSLQLTGTLNGTGTLTAANYNLYAGTVNANLGTGTLNVLRDANTGNTVSTLNGTAAASTVQVFNLATLALGASNRLADTASVFVNAGGTLDLGSFSDTVGSLQLAGTLNGTGTLTATSYLLTGGTANANLGTGTLTQASGTSTLNGTSGATIVNVNAGTLALGASNRLADNAAVSISSGATLNLAAFTDTVGSLTLGGTLAGTGTLTATNYTLTGGTANANLGRGMLTQASGTSTLNGTSGATTVNINGGTLALGSSNRLADAAAVSVLSGATLNLAAFTDTVGSLTLGGTLAGTGTLTAANYTLTGGTANANLGIGTLTQASGSSTLNGTSGATIVNINGGTLALGASNRLDDTAMVSVASGATLNLAAFTDTVGSLTLGGTLAGTGTLTAASYTLTGGTANANLGTGTLTQASGSSTLNGTSGAATVNVNGGTLSLGASNRLADAAPVSVAAGATLNLAAFTDTVGSLTLGGTLAGTGTLTAANYTLTGGTANANLGTGTLTQASGSSTLNGTSGATTVNVNGGTLSLGASNRLADAAPVSVASGATLNLAAFSDTVGSLALSGTLAGTGTLTAASYTLTGGTANANLGTGTLTQASGSSTLSGTSGAAIVNINGGTLALGASERLASTSAVQIANGATLNLANYTQTVGTIGGTGTLALGTGRLAVGGTNADFAYSGNITGSGDVDKNGTGTFTLASNLAMTGRLNANAGTTVFSGSTAGAVQVKGGTLTGNGAIAGNLLISSGAFSPGTTAQPIGAFSAGSLTVSGGNLNIDLGGSAANFASDTIRVNGAATLTGGTVVAQSLKPTGNYRVSQTYTIVQANSLTGTFANSAALSPVSNDPNLQFRLRYDLIPNSVVLELRRQIDFSNNLGPNPTGNQLAIGQALNGGAFTASDNWASILNNIAGQTPAQRSATYDSISGEAISDITSSTSLVASGFTDLLRHRIAFGGTAGGDSQLLGDLLQQKPQFAALVGPVPVGGAPALGSDQTVADHHDVQRSNAWIQGVGSNGRIDGLSGQAGLNTFSAGVAGGIDVQRGKVSFGGAFAVNQLDAQVRDRTSSSSGTLYQGGGYLAYDDGHFYGSILGSYFKGNINSTRSVFNGGTSAGQATGQAPTRGYTAAAATGYRLPLAHDYLLTSQVSFTATGIVRDGFTESGAGGLSLQLDRSKRQLYTTTVEGRLSRKLNALGGVIEPYLGGGVNFNLGDLDTLDSARFTGAPIGTGGFTVTGARLAPITGMANAGIEAHPTDSVTLGLGAEATYAQRERQGSVYASIRFRF